MTRIKMFLHSCSWNRFNSHCQPDSFCYTSQNLLGKPSIIPRHPEQSWVSLIFPSLVNWTNTGLFASTLANSTKFPFSTPNRLLQNPDTNPAATLLDLLWALRHQSSWRASASVARWLPCLQIPDKGSTFFVLETWLSETWHYNIKFGHFNQKSSRPIKIKFKAWRLWRHRLHGSRFAKRFFQLYFHLLPRKPLLLLCNFKIDLFEAIDVPLLPVFCFHNLLILHSILFSFWPDSILYWKSPPSYFFFFLSYSATNSFWEFPEALSIF